MNIVVRGKPALILALALGVFSAVRSGYPVNTPSETAFVYLPIALNAYPPPFSFVSWGDAQDGGVNLPGTSNQAAALDPVFTIFNGDFISAGFDLTQMEVEAAAMNGGVSKNGLFNRTFLVRGNHDNQGGGSTALWENYFAGLSRPLPAGVTDYTALDPSSTYLTYSFDYGNSRFIGADVPGNADLLTQAQAAFIDGRLSDAGARGLAHAFIFFHGPEYCVESRHCACSRADDASCTPASIVDLINRHPIVSATFHGHEHILGWVHMSSARLPALTHAYEEFITSPSGASTYNSYLFPARVDYANLDNTQGFALVSVNGASFTVSLYRVGTALPVWSKTFYK